MLDLLGEMHCLNHSQVLSFQEVRCKLTTVKSKSTEFLVPTGDIRLRIRNHTIDDNLLMRLAKKYSVSREVILRKCLDLNYVTSAFYEAKVNEWNGERLARGSSGSRGNSYYTKGAYLGSYYIEYLYCE